MFILHQYRAVIIWSCGCSRRDSHKRASTCRLSSESPGVRKTEKTLQVNPDEGRTGCKKVQMNLSELSKLYDFTGRSVVVTGGTGVLGRSMVEALVGCGANVALCARNLDKGEALVASLKGPGRVIAVKCDVLKAPELEQARGTVLENFGGVDCLVNAAGGNQPEATTSDKLSFFDLPAGALRQVF